MKIINENSNIRVYEKNKGESYEKGNEKDIVHPTAPPETSSSKYQPEKSYNQ